MFVLGFIILAAPPVHGSAIRLKSSIVADRPVVTLGDVADVHDAQPGVQRQLEQIVLGPAPAAGRQTRFDFSAIRSRLLAQGVNLATTEFTGSNTVTVRTPESRPDTASSNENVSSATLQMQQKRAEQLVVPAVKQYLQPQLGAADHFDFHVTIAPESVPLVLEGAANGYRVSGGHAPWDAPQQLTLELLGTAGKLHRLPIAASISVRPQMVTVKFNVPRGHLLRVEDLVSRPASDGVRGLMRIDDVANKETTRSLRRGEPIDRDDVQNVPLVRSNDIVTVHARRPGLVVTRPMKARGSASLNETAVFVTLDGRTQVTARVVGYHEAEIIGSGSTEQEVVGASSGRLSFYRRSEELPQSEPTTTRRVLQTEPTLQNP